MTFFEFFYLVGVPVGVSILWFLGERIPSRVGIGASVLAGVILLLGMFRRAFSLDAVTWLSGLGYVLLATGPLLVLVSVLRRSFLPRKRYLMLLIGPATYLLTAFVVLTLVVNLGLVSP